MDREDIANRVIEVTQAMAKGYRDSVNEWSTPGKRETAEAAAKAASNAAFFILFEFGFSMDEIKQRVEAYRQQKG